MFPAYHESMEMLIVLFILALSEKDPKLKETLKSVLSFYRENRELLMAFSSAQTAPPAAPASAPASSETSGSSYAGDGVRILEEFLRRKF